MRDINSTSRGNALAPNRCNSLSCTVRTSRQRFCSQRVDWLLCIVAMIYDLWYRSMDKRKVRCLVPLWSGWLLSSSTAIPHRFRYIDTKRAKPPNILFNILHTYILNLLLPCIITTVLLLKAMPF